MKKKFFPTKLKKVEQVYEKTKRSYSKDSVFTEIKELYDELNEKRKRGKKKAVVYWIITFVWLPILILMIVLIGSIS